MDNIYLLFTIYFIFIVCFTLLFSFVRKYIDKLGSYVSKNNESIIKKILAMYIIYIILGLPLTIIVYLLYTKILLNAIVITVSILTCIRILANPTYYLNDKLDYDLANKYKGQYLGLLLGFIFASLLILFISKFDQISFIINNINVIEILKLFPSLNVYSILFYFLFVFIGALASEFTLYHLDPIVQTEYIVTKNSITVRPKATIKENIIKLSSDGLNVTILILSLFIPWANSGLYQ